MIEFSYRLVGAAPALLAKREGLLLPAPIVLWFHGLGVEKDTHRAELARFADLGFLAIGIDSVGHGARRLPDLEERINASREETFTMAVDLAAQTAAEVPQIITELIGERLAIPERIAVAGISMGAFVVYGAVPGSTLIKRAVAILGTPEWPRPSSPHQNPKAFCGIELLSITAERDENVPPGPARTLHLALESVCPTNHRYVELEGAVHLMNARDWERTMDETTRWLTRG